MSDLKIVFPIDIVPLTPRGTNSTFFTECCVVAICNDQRNCPHCNQPIVGYDEEDLHDRGIVRWKNATRRWKRK